MTVSVAVDAMGGDTAPESIVQGACEASLNTDVMLHLVGDVAAI